MSRVWKLAVPLAVVIVVGGYAVGSLAASDLDDVTPRQPIVIGDDADPGHGTGTREGASDDRRERPDQKDDQRGDDGRADDADDDDDVAVVRPDVDDLDDDDGDDDHDDGGDRADD